jgi:hypothetical protein
LVIFVCSCLIMMQLCWFRKSWNSFFLLKFTVSAHCCRLTVHRVIREKISRNNYFVFIAIYESFHPVIRWSRCPESFTIRTCVLSEKIELEVNQQKKSDSQCRLTVQHKMSPEIFEFKYFSFNCYFKNCNPKYLLIKLNRTFLDTLTDE